MAVDPVYDTVASFAAGLVEQGVTDVVVSPGSRSTPLTLTLHAQPGLRTWIQLDERSAGFFALGQARRTGRPSVLVCTSGTAAANYFPAVIEAHHAGVPMIVCTADRPPEMRDWGSPQTIDQVKLYGAATRWAVDLAVAGEWSGARGRLVAHRAAVSATGVDPGPVHLNWPLREPLEPVADVPVVYARAAGGHAVGVPAMPGDSIAAGGHAVGVPAMPGDSIAAGDSTALASYERGVIIVGPDAGRGIKAQNEVVTAALKLSAATAWPVIGEPIAGARRAGDDSVGTVIANADHILRHAAVAEELRPDVVIRLGGTPTTKPLRLWLEACRPTHVLLIDPANRWNDPSFMATRHVAADPAAVLRALAGSVRRESTWRDRWKELDLIAAQAIRNEIGQGPLLSALVTSVLSETVPAGTLVMASNSMPVRELDSFVPTEGPRIDFVGNRGAGGIDGITSTALGLASQHDGPVVLYIGDLALLHDLGALFGAARCGLHLTVVCVDNNGGGIFASLPIASCGDEVDFETLFRTPHGLDLADFSGVGGVRIKEVASASELAEALRSSCEHSTPGVDVLLVPVDPDADLAQHRAIAEAVEVAVS
ncbi:MAG: 2-succinyl-5-enolpyruvyl-6-hydroxy-3-cyclohexene-1-carboxylic-acid synthase [Acidimicrobiaceae bacterium]|nr:2-succinyl-5-enolpyruvyl-6-hydroxy-3-cyclohexene-1-carboxylic-acid synthase [Acidimicrobiaceae bacterium]